MKLIEKDYPVVIGQDVIWGDMDAYGHVNNTIYFRYFEDARIAYFNRIGMQVNKKPSGQGPILAATNCNFRRPLDYPDHILIAARATILSAKKINMEYVVFSEEQQAVAAEGAGLVVYYDYANGRSCEIPEEIVAAIAALEG